VQAGASGGKEVGGVGRREEWGKLPIRIAHFAVVLSATVLVKARKNRPSVDQTGLLSPQAGTFPRKKNPESRVMETGSSQG